MERPRGFVCISSRRLKVASPLYMMFGPLTEPPFVTCLLNKDLLGVWFGHQLDILCCGLVSFIFNC